MSTGSRYAIVTGAASGIGLATATALARQGWTVGLFDVNETSLRSLARTLGGAAVPVVCDVTSLESWNDACRTFAQHSDGMLDLLVNNAGLVYSGHFENQDPRHQATLLAVNNLGVAYGCRATLAMLRRSAERERRPVVVNMASASSLAGIPGMATYAASKAFVRSLTDALASEWHRHGIAVRDVSPPFVNTPMIAQCEDNLLLAKLGVDCSPEDVAAAVLAASRGGARHQLMTLQLKGMAFLRWVLPHRVFHFFLRIAAGY